MPPNHRCCRHGSSSVWCSLNSAAMPRRFLTWKRVLRPEPKSPRCCSRLDARTRGVGDPRAEAIAERLSKTPDGQPLWHQLQGLVLQRDDQHRKALGRIRSGRRV